tara:strand:- start:290 stop:1198 length:909 start_codon:yes stop_codon:yes gene_type:complete
MGAEWIILSNEVPNVDEPDRTGYWASTGDMTDEEYQYMLDQNIDMQIKAQGMQSWTSYSMAGASSLSSLGPFGMLVGGIIGGVMGMVDGFMQGHAMAANALEEYRDRKEIDAAFEEARQLGTYFTNRLASFLTPLEQGFRNRMRQYGARAASSGLTGAQAFAAQQDAERMYRETVGPALPGIYSAAQEDSRSEWVSRLKAIELKAGIIMADRRQDLAEYIGVAEGTRAVASGFFGAMGTMGGTISGTGDDEIPDWARELMAETGSETSSEVASDYTGQGAEAQSVTVTGRGPDSMQDYLAGE